MGKDYRIVIEQGQYGTKNLKTPLPSLPRPELSQQWKGKSDDQVAVSSSA